MNRQGLTTENLQVGYDKKIILGDVSIQVQPGKIVTLIGPNGCGKSTILKSIAGQLEKLGGVVFLAGEDVKNLGREEMAKNLSVVMTKPLQTEMMNCFDVAATGRYPYTGHFGILSGEDKSKVWEALEIVGAKELADRDFGKISDGQRQRIMLARALCQEPKVLLLDEPTSFLDIKYKADILKSIVRLAKEKQIAVLLSLHELDLAKAVSDMVVCVGEGKIEKIGTAEQIFSSGTIAKLFHMQAEDFDENTATINLSAFSLPDADASVEKDETHNSMSDSAVKIQAAKECEEGSEHKVKVLMVQGTMSNAGKSLLVAGLCRIFKQDGYRVAPFKSQNMALNSFITLEGLEMGRAQVMQAEAAGMEPEVAMNPILLKPTSDRGSQVIVHGKVRGNMPAREYFAYKKQLIPEIRKAFRTLSEKADIIVIEGAGSPAEINLKENDIVNMGLAALVDAPVLLVGDIDRGGVFAQLLGTLQLLEPEEKARVKGLVINKFRGDKTILDPGIDMLEERGGIPVTGVVPYMRIQVDDEDSLSSRFDKQQEALVNIAVVRFPRIANFSDFSAFERIEGVAVHYVADEKELECADLIILPGSKNTIADLKWLRESGLEAQIKKFAEYGPVIGICGGYQMLGAVITDPDFVEQGGRIRGMELLPVETVLKNEKTTTRVKGQFAKLDGIFSCLSDKELEGYEIHMGETLCVSDEGIKKAVEFHVVTDENANEQADGAVSDNGYILGTYVHGVFDYGDIAYCIAAKLAERKGVALEAVTEKDYKAFKESQYDLLADTLRKHMDMQAVYDMLNEVSV